MDILEEDFGCEGIPEDAEVMIRLVLRDENGQESFLRFPDNLATAMDLQIGDTVRTDDEGNIEKQ